MGIFQVKPLSYYDPGKDKNLVDAGVEQQLGEAAAAAGGGQAPVAGGGQATPSPTPDPDEIYEENIGGYQGKIGATGSGVWKQGQPIGQFGKGNIDLYDRPQFVNEDGSLSTVRSISANFDGKEILLPTIARDSNGNAILLTDEQAKQRYRDTGEHLGIFDSIDEANKYADLLHKEQEQYYLNKSTKPSVPTYLADWGADGVNLRSEYEKGQYSPVQLAHDMNAWAKANGKDPVDIIDLISLSQDVDLNKSKNVSTEEEKKLKNQEKWERFGNVLLHLGNFVGTIAGGPSQTYESAQELTKRQQLLRDKTIAARQAANKAYIDGLLGERKNELENRKLNRLETETKIRQEKNDAYINAQRAKVSGDEARAAYWNTKADLLERGYSLEEAEKKAKIAETESRTRLNNVRANAGGFAPRSSTRANQGTETTVTKTNADGETITTKTVKKPLGGATASTKDNSNAGKGKNRSTGKDYSQYIVK